jgi:hypothetical protein
LSVGQSEAYCDSTDLGGVARSGAGTSAWEWREIGNDADGIYCDGCADVVIERNGVSTSDLGIEVASEHSGHVSTDVTVRNHLVYDNNSNGISISALTSSSEIPATAGERAVRALSAVLLD